MNVLPEEMVKRMNEYAEAIRLAKSKEVAVGIPRGEATSKIYGDGTTVLQVAAIHEFGAGPIPERSFLRVPFREKRKDLNEMLAHQFERVANGEINAMTALGLVGATARNISVEAFSTQGYGKWPDLSPITVELRRSGGAKSGADVGNAAKASRSAFFEPAAAGEMTPLVDTGTLRNSITWDVRDAT